MGRVRQCVLAVLVLAVLAAPAVAGTRDTGSASVSPRPSLDRKLLAQVNALRAARGFGPLRLSAGLSAAARQHSVQMARRGYFAHESADGGLFWRRVEHFYGSAGYSSWRVGENLLWASPDIGARAAVEGWLASPRHRQVLLDGHWQDVGLSAVHVAGAPGAFQGRDVTIVTVDFGSRVT